MTKKIIIVVILLAAFAVGKFSSWVHITIAPPEKATVEDPSVLGVAEPAVQDIDTDDEDNTTAVTEEGITEEEVQTIAGLAQAWSNTEGTIDIYDESDIADVTTGVVLNRKKSPNYPDSIEDIITTIQKESGLGSAEPSQETITQVRKTLENGESIVRNALFIVPCKVWDDKDPAYFKYSVDDAYGNYYALIDEPNSLAE